jgi:type I restriction enzyme M protein
VLNKRKAPERKGKTLLIWASRDYESNNPQNIIRRADCLRILVPWKAFGDLNTCCEIIPNHEAQLVAEIERERDAALSDIEAAYEPFLEPLTALRRELAERVTFAEREAPPGKEERKKFREEKKENGERLKVVKREVKSLEKLEVEADEKRAAARLRAERESALANFTASELQRICGNPQEAARYFVLADREEIQENEFNLNLPRYVDTFEPEDKIDVGVALKDFDNAEEAAVTAVKKLRDLLESVR